MKMNSVILIFSNLIFIGFIIFLYKYLKKRYFDTKIERLEKELIELEDKESNKKGPIILSDLPKEENIFSEGFDEEFNVSEYEIEDPYKPKTLTDLDKLFKEKNNNLDLGDDIQSLL